MASKGLLFQQVDGIIEMKRHGFIFPPLPTQLQTSKEVLKVSPKSCLPPSVLPLLKHKQSDRLFCFRVVTVTI